MVGLLRNLIQIGVTLFVAMCMATVSVQVIGLGVMSSRGMLTSDKVVRYAGILYGLEPIDLAPGKKPEQQKRPEQMHRDELLADRVSKLPEISDRQLAVQKGSDDIRGVVLGLKLKRDRQESARKVFDTYLQQLENDITVGALREIQAMIESLPPKQAKEIVRSMLTDPVADPVEDDVMADVVNIIQSMPAEKTRKIFDEFKSEDERVLLHRILVEIGKLGEPSSQLSGNQP